ncbi:MAG: hypothetical protein WBB07_09765 [Mycobacterium sp.]
MKLTLRREGDKRSWPAYLFWGRLRTSTVALIVAFFVTAWLYETYQPPPAPPVPAPGTQIVPPGFVPDPEYTWVPRTSVREYPIETFTPTPTPTTTPPTTTTTPETETPETGVPEPTTTGPSPATTTAPTPPNPFMPTPPTPQTTATTEPPPPVPAV